MRWIAKFIRIPADEKRLLTEAVFFLFYSKALVLFPFRIYIKKLKPAGNPQQAPHETLKKIQMAVSRANKLACWQNVCLVRSVTARLMLQRRQIISVLYLGLQITDKKELIAHAWLVSSGMEITPKGKTNYKEIFSV